MCVSSGSALSVLESLRAMADLGLISRWCPACGVQLGAWVVPASHCVASGQRPGISAVPASIFPFSKHFSFSLSVCSGRDTLCGQGFCVVVLWNWNKRLSGFLHRDGLPWVWLEAQLGAEWRFSAQRMRGWDRHWCFTGTSIVERGESALPYPPHGYDSTMAVASGGVWASLFSIER